MVIFGHNQRASDVRVEVWRCGGSATEGFLLWAFSVANQRFTFPTPSEQPHRFILALSLKK